MKRRREQGYSLSKAIKGPLWYLRRGRTFRCDRARVFMLSRGGFLRLYYKWLKGGQTPEAVALNFKPGVRRQLEPDEISRIARVCLAPLVSSLKAAYRTLPFPTATYSAYWYALPPAVQSGIRAVHKARRRAESLEKQARRELVSWERKRAAATEPRNAPGTAGVNSAICVAADGKRPAGVNLKGF